MGLVRRLDPGSVLPSVSSSDQGPPGRTVGALGAAGCEAQCSPGVAAVPTAALGQGGQGQVAGGARCVMVRLERVEDGRRSVAMVDTEERARELEQLGYQRVYREVEEHDRGSGGGNPDNR